jgi:hypothetical protein
MGDGFADLSWPQVRDCLAELGIAPRYGPKGGATSKKAKRIKLVKQLAPAVDALADKVSALSDAVAAYDARLAEQAAKADVLARRLDKLLVDLGADPAMPKAFLAANGARRV